MSQKLGKDDLRFGPAAGLVEQETVTRAGFGAGIIVGDGLVFEQRLLGVAAVFERAGIKQMPVGGLVVRPTHTKVFKRRNRILRMSEPELSARFAERIDRIVAHRQRQTAFVVAL